MSDYILFLGIIVAIDFVLIWFVLKRLQFRAGFFITLAVLVVLRYADDLNWDAALTAVIDPVDLAVSAVVGALYSWWQGRRRTAISAPDQKKT